MLIGLLLTGVTSLVVQSMQFSAIYKNDMLGGLLAQEGIELVRFQRDTNRLQGNNNWLEGLTNPPAPCWPQECIAKINPVDGVVTFSRCVGLCANANNGEMYLWQDTATGIYAHQKGAPGWVQTPFRRLIQVQDISNGSVKAARVTVTVQWKGRYGDDEIVVRDILTDWQ